MKQKIFEYIKPLGKFLVIFVFALFFSTLKGEASGTGSVYFTAPNTFTGGNIQVNVSATDDNWGGAPRGPVSTSDAVTPPPPTASIIASPTSVNVGDTVNWTWSSTYAASAQSQLTANDGGCPDQHGYSSVDVSGNIGGPIPSTYAGCSYTDTFQTTNSTGPVATASASFSVSCGGNGQYYCAHGPSSGINNGCNTGLNKSSGGICYPCNGNADCTSPGTCQSSPGTCLAPSTTSANCSYSAASGGTSCNGGLNKCSTTGTCTCNADYLNSCGGTVCINAGSYDCNGICGGTSFKTNGTICGTGMTCDGSGNCIVNVSGVCGPANGSYGADYTSYSGAYCTAGTADSSPSFPYAGNSASWNCLGSGNGTNAPCSASRSCITLIYSSATSGLAVNSTGTPASSVIVGSQGQKLYGFCNYGTQFNSGYVDASGLTTVWGGAVSQPPATPGWSGTAFVFQITAPNTGVGGTYAFTCKTYNPTSNLSYDGCTANSNSSGTVKSASQPSVTVTSPTAGPVSGVLPVTGTVTADPLVSISKVEIWASSTPTLLASSDPASPKYVAGMFAGSSFSYNYDTAGLTNGAHTFSVIAYDTVGNQTTKPVAVTVSNAPTITLTPATFSFAATVGNSPLAQSLSIGNSGDASMTWNASTNQAWCHISSSSATIGAFGSSPVLITVDVATVIMVGINNCTVTVTAAGATNTPQTAAVTYTVIAGDPGSGPTYVACSNGACVSSSTAASNLCTDDTSCGASSCGSSGCGGDPSAVSTDNSICEKLILNWNKGTGATGYKIWRNTSNSIPGSAYKTVASSTLSITENYPADVALNTPYYYWVSSVGGGGNQIAANTNSTGSAKAISCTPPPSPPSGPPGGLCNSQNTCPPDPGPGPVNPPTGGGPYQGGGSPTCGYVRLEWNDGSTNEDSFKVYRNSSNSFPGSTLVATVNSTTKAATSATYGIDLNLGSDTTPYYYWVTAYNNVGVESTPLAFSGTVAAYACVASLDKSDKKIIALNGGALPHGTCDNINTILPSYVTPKQYDVLSYTVELCNQNGAATATQISIVDSLTSQDIPAAGFNAKYNGAALSYDGACAATPNPAQDHYCVAGSLPSKTLYFNLGSAGDNILAGASKALTYDTMLNVPASFSGLNGRFQNNALISYNNGVTTVNFNEYNPLQMFVVGKGAPSIIEKP